MPSAGQPSGVLGAGSIARRPAVRPPGAAGSQAPREPIVAKPDTVYQCPMCEVRLIGEQYCEECHSFARRLGPGGNCPCCDEPISVTELLQPEQFVARKGQKTTRGR